MKSRWSKCLCVIAMLLGQAGCSESSTKTYEFPAHYSAKVNITPRDGMIDIICVFAAQKSLSTANNAMADKRTASIVAQKALCRYFSVKSDEELLVRGMESDSPVYFKGNVKVRFIVGKDNCEKIKKTITGKD